MDICHAQPGLTTLSPGDSWCLFESLPTDDGALHYPEVSGHDPEHSRNCIRRNSLTRQH